MFCKATTGILLVRRCRFQAAFTCAKCTNVFCRNHFNQNTKTCRACSPGETSHDGDPNSPAYRRAWATHYYHEDFESDGFDYDYDDSFTAEDYAAFDDLQRFDQDEVIERAYDS